MDMQVDAQKDQWPKRDRESRRPDLRQRLDVREIVVGGSDDRPGDEVGNPEEA